MPRGVYKRKKLAWRPEHTKRALAALKDEPHIPAKKDLIRAYLSSLEYDLQHLVKHVESLKKLVN